jgi:2-C-methyl-D-erythritol 2,4-cyclodiphosphate synthase
MQIRVGNGFDIHRFSEDPTRVLVLGGVKFPGHPGLEGHSDADVITHVCAESILGAAGLGDLGSHFPDTDPQFSGIDSLRLLAAAVTSVHAEGWQIQNVDISVIAEGPKLAPARSAMQSNLSSITNCPVSIKGRRAEGLGALGRSEGIAAFATACIIQS